MEQQKAAKIAPARVFTDEDGKVIRVTTGTPENEPGIVDVDMTHVFTALGVLGVLTTGLTASTVYLWRKTKRNSEYLEALREYTSRLVLETRCGKMAYQSIVDGAAEEDRAVDWSNEIDPFIDDEEEEDLVDQLKHKERE
jgi:hypothetical protein